MKNILIFKIWQHKISASAALFTTIAIFFWPSIPLRSINAWLKFFYAYSPQNYFYLTMSILSGIYIGIYIYNKKVAKCCSVQNLKVGASASLTGILLGACPACIPLLAFLLPLSVTIVLSRLSLLFLLISNVIMLFAIYKLNGFKKI